MFPGWNHHCWMAWGYKGLTECSSTLPHLSRRHDHRRWTHLTQRSPHHSTIRKGKSTEVNPRRTPRHLQMPVLSQTVCLLAWYQCWHQEDGWSMPNMPTTPPTGTTTTTPIHPSTWMTMATPGSWLLQFWWIRVFGDYQLLHKDAICEKDVTIPV